MKGIRNFKSLLWSIVLMGSFYSVGFGQIEWSKSLLNMGDGFFSKVVETKDSNYWAIGYSYYNGGGARNLIVKFDKNGNIQFTKDPHLLEDIYLIDEIESCADNGALISYKATDSRGSFIQKLDKNGNIIWSQDFKFSPDSIDDIYDVEFNQLPDGKIIAKEYFILESSVEDTSGCILTLIESNGNILWKKRITLGGRNYRVFEELKINSFILSNRYAFDKTAIPLLHFFEYDFNGNLLAQKEIIFKDNNFDIIQPISDSCYLRFNMRGNNSAVRDFTLAKYKKDTLLWKKTIALAKDIRKISFPRIIEDKKKNIVLSGNEFISKIDGTSLGIIMALDSLGNLIKYERYYPKYSNFSGINYMIESSDNFYLACGVEANNFGNDRKPMIIKTKASNLFSFLTGKVILDTNSNCQTDSLEKKAKAISIQAQNTKGETYYGITQNDGTYDILASGDSLTLTTNVNSPYYQQTCTPATVKFTGVSQSIQKDLFLQKTADCPYLNVNIANRALRPCFDAVQVVNFCNHGSAVAQNAYIEVQLDANLTFQSSTKTAIPKGNNLYRFDLGNIPIDSCGQFTISTKVACDNSLLGKTLCNSAHIFPDSLCAPQDNGKIQVTGTCNGSTIDFKIKNVDAKAMKSSKNYIVIEDHVMFKQGSFNLTPNQVETVSIPAQAGKTYRIIAEQTNPIYGNLATIAFENCNVSASPTTGMINQFPQGDDSPFEDTDCRVVTASYDPNDKQAVPEGVNNQHFIAKNTDLEYMIRFQNKGTDTAFLVIIKDTLSQFLDPATIELGASSHPCKFDLTDRGIAKFIFSGINLPHEKVDKEGSNGFVKFRIKQRRDLPNGTVINNKAAIYFDYNDPIITNTTYHTIGENWLMIVPNKEVNEATIDITVFPNPFNESTRIEAQIGEEHNNLTFNLFDTNGRMVRSENFVGKTLDFQRNGLQNGFYFYEIKSDNKRLGTGKLVVF